MKRQYNITDYTANYTQFSGNKGSEENAIVAIIMNLINNNKFDSIDDALKYNGNDYNTFMKNNRRDNIPAHYGRNIKDADFKLIITQFKKMDEDKLKFDKEDIKEYQFDDKEYVEYNGTVLDNSYSNNTIKEELHELQEETPDYQTLDSRRNVDKMMDEMTDRRKREVEFTDINRIDRSKLNEKEQQLYDTALVDQYLSDENKELSLEDGLIKSDNNEISQLKSVDSGIEINNNDLVNNVVSSIRTLSQIDESQLNSMEMDIYNAAKRYQTITGELIRLDLNNMVIITPSNEVKEIITRDGVLVVNDDRVLFNDAITSSDEMEQEITNEKVKKLEFIKPFANYNANSNVA